MKHLPSLDALSVKRALHLTSQASSSHQRLQPGLTASDSMRLRARSLDWHKLVDLGVSDSEAQIICQRLQLRSLSQIYGRRLQRSGVHRDEAKLMAAAIAHYDLTGALPSPETKTMLIKHGLLICRSALWRSPMFTKSPGSEDRKTPTEAAQS